MGRCGDLVFPIREELIVTNCEICDEDFWSEYIDILDDVSKRSFHYPVRNICGDCKMKLKEVVGKI